MLASRKQMIEELKSIEEPKLIQEGDIQSDNILRVVSSQGGYRLETDSFPIDGPFEISSDEYNEMANMNEDGEGPEILLDLSEDQLEMVEAGCDAIQGYYFGEPLAVEAVTASIDDSVILRRWTKRVDASRFWENSPLAESEPSSAANDG